MSIFKNLLRIDCPGELHGDRDDHYAGFEVRFIADGRIPFPQVIVHLPGNPLLLKQEAIQERRRADGTWEYRTRVPKGKIHTDTPVTIQVEGCRLADIGQAQGEDWIKAFREVRLVRVPASEPVMQVALSGGVEVKLYFGIHKHLHQPYYNTTDRNAWDGEKEQIFGSRHGNYTDFLPAAVRQYQEGGLAHAGLSTSWSGSLIEQLDRCADEGLCGGRFSGWNQALRAMAGARTALGHPRLAFSAFGFFHPLMPLIPHWDLVRQIRWHREIIRRTFDVEASRVLFPPETAFHVRMIPALVEAGVEAVIYDSIHRFRACRDYPYAGLSEGMLPPNAAEQVNPAMDDWLQLHNIWAGSRISPRLLKPEYVGYEDPDGQIHRIVAVPAERYIGNEDARGGFGALQYPDVLGQVYDRLAATGGLDPAHPPFFLLHSDGDNHGGGADSYYKHNTGRLVAWLQRDPRFELSTVEDYLRRFPPDPAQTVHIEPGSWAGANNGDPQFMKWFSRYDQPYSPDLNSWAVLTAFQSQVHSLECREPEHPALAEAIRLLLTAETSCYWYWTGQRTWDQQVTNAANLGHDLLQPAIQALIATGGDRQGPTIFPPWVTPENPGGKCWGPGCLHDAPGRAIVHTFVADIAGLKGVDLILRLPGGEKRLPMHNLGPYPSQTGARVTADYLTAELPAGAGDVRYYLEAEDRRGNVTRSSLERIFLA